MSRGTLNSGKVLDLNHMRPIQLKLITTVQTLGKGLKINGLSPASAFPKYLSVVFKTSPQFFKPFPGLRHVFKCVLRCKSVTRLVPGFLMSCSELGICTLFGGLVKIYFILSVFNDPVFQCMKKKRKAQ